MTIKSRNFSTPEVCHRPIPKELLPCAYFLQGTLQAIRDYCTTQYLKEVQIHQISGYRPPEVNAETPGAAEQSNHIWSVEPFKVAADITTNDIHIMDLYHACRALVRGEVYVDENKKKVHIAPCGPIKKPWVQ